MLNFSQKKNGNYRGWGQERKRGQNRGKCDAKGRRRYGERKQEGCTPHGRRSTADLPSFARSIWKRIVSPCYFSRCFFCRAFLLLYVSCDRTSINIALVNTTKVRCEEASTGRRNGTKINQKNSASRRISWATRPPSWLYLPQPSRMHSLFSKAFPIT